VAAFGAAVSLTIETRRKLSCAPRQDLNAVVIEDCVFTGCVTGDAALSVLRHGYCLMETSAGVCEYLSRGTPMITLPPDRPPPPPPLR
jgi:hypothetical protein